MIDCPLSYNESGTGQGVNHISPMLMIYLSFSLRYLYGIHPQDIKKGNCSIVLAACGKKYFFQLKIVKLFKARNRSLNEGGVVSPDTNHSFYNLPVHLVKSVTLLYTLVDSWKQALPLSVLYTC